MKGTVERKINRGSITVEASIIVPLVILSISAVIYMGLLLYQRSLIQSAAEAAVQAGAQAWVTGTDTIEASGPINADSKNFKLYRRIYDSEKDKRLEKIQDYALALSSRTELIPSFKSTAEAVLTDYAVYRKLEVRIYKHYRMPLGKLMKLFGGDDTVTISAKATSTINDPDEFIRTADLVIDIEKKLENKFPELKRIGDKTRETLNDMKDKLKKFVD